MLCYSDINMEQTEIKALNNRDTDLRTLESIFIIKDKPVLNENEQHSLWSDCRFLFHIFPIFRLQPKSILYARLYLKKVYI